jgi:hypothetical protein
MATRSADKGEQKSEIATNASWPTLMAQRHMGNVAADQGKKEQEKEIAPTLFWPIAFMAQCFMWATRSVGQWREQKKEIATNASVYQFPCNSMLMV